MKYTDLDIMKQLQKWIQIIQGTSRNIVFIQAVD